MQSSWWTAGVKTAVFRLLGSESKAVKCNTTILVEIWAWHVLLHHNPQRKYFTVFGTSADTCTWQLSQHVHASDQLGLCHFSVFCWLTSTQGDKHLLFCVDHCLQRPPKGYYVREIKPNLPHLYCSIITTDKSVSRADRAWTSQKLLPGFHRRQPGLGLDF